MLYYWCISTKSSSVSSFGKSLEKLWQQKRHTPKKKKKKKKKKGKKRKKKNSLEILDNFFQRPIAITAPENLTQVFIFLENALTPGIDV